MSWQGYIDNNLLGTKKVVQAAICGIDGNLWASSPDFKPNQTEVKAIVNGVRSNESSSSLAATGIRANGVKYMFLRTMDGRSAYGKLGNSGICAVVTTQAVLIGTYNDDIQPGECTVAVEALADYLISVGY